MARYLIVEAGPGLGSTLLGVLMIGGVLIAIAPSGQSSGSSGSTQATAAAPYAANASRAVVTPSTSSATSGANRPLSTNGQKLGNKQGGRDWGERCFRHLKAGELESAHADCEAGLLSNPEPATQGAIYYNLGLIAEKRGQSELASQHYSKSIAVRPSGQGVSTVKVALARVSKDNSSSAVGSENGALRRLQPSETNASSYFANKYESHPADHAFDGNPKTAWNEGVPGPGKNEWLEASFKEPVRLRRIDLATGYDAISLKFGDLFTMNAHARRVTFLFDDQVGATKDVGNDQRLLTLDNFERTASKVRFVFEDVWDGAKWHDLCVSEVAFFGER
jgi:hypothetical protein